MKGIEPQGPEDWGIHGDIITFTFAHTASKPSICSSSLQGKQHYTLVT